MTRVLITGGAGFIGSHLCDDLIQRDYQVTILDGFSAQVHGPEREPKFINRRARVIPEFTMNEGATLQALEDVDVVVHLGALVGVGQSMYDIADYTYFNTHGTATLLEAMIGKPIKKLIVASSMSVYGEGERAIFFQEEEDGETARKPLATSEYKPVDLQSIYALTKYDQERMCLLWGRAYKVPTIALRFFNVYGPRQSLSNPYTGAVAIFASRLLNGKPPIIYEDGYQSRDFVYVSDVVNGIRLAMESDVQDEVINIGTGRRTMILSLAEGLATELGVDIHPEITGQKRVGDIRHCWADITKARGLLKYEPQVGIVEGIRKLVPWLREQTAIDRVEEHKLELEEKGLLV